ncbi:MAG: flagellar hook-basal body complex protein FliE, partial [Acidobacteriota bacterium]
ESKGRFAELLSKALDEVDQLQESSGQETGKILSGDINDVHSAMIAMEKADLSFQMVMQVRNKLVEAYQEVMRMQV